jgi:uncharacterized phage protein (TIGR02218 family)
MRALPAALAASLASGATSLCHCWRVQRRDGVVMGFTDHDQDLAFGGATFAARGGFDATQLESELGLKVGGGEVTGALVADTIDETDIANGRYDGASVECWLVDHTAIASRVLLDAGTIGEVKRGDFGFTAEIRGLAHALDQETGRYFQAGCAADLGDARCGVNLATGTYTASGTIVTTDGRVRFTAAIAGFADQWFSNGTLQFSSGANAGVRVSVKDHRFDGAVATFLLWTPLGAALAAGDAFTATAGCDKSFSTCIGKFANAANFRGFPMMPGNDYVTGYPIQSDTTLDGTALR